MIEFVVLGVPQPQGSKTRTRYGGMREDNAALMPWRDSVIAAARTAMSDGDVPTELGPVGVEAMFLFARPRSHYGTGRNANTIRPAAPIRYHAQKPDADKLLRALGDALTIARVLRDDSQIASMTAFKQWADGPSMGVTVWRLT